MKNKTLSILHRLTGRQNDNDANGNQPEKLHVFQKDHDDPCLTQLQNENALLKSKCNTLFNEINDLRKALESQHHPD